MEDAQIIDGFFRRDPEAITAVQEKYEKRCLAAAGHILPDRRDAEECVSDVWLRLWNAIPPERPRSLAAYITTVTRRVALDKCDYNRAAQRRSDLTVAFEGRTILSNVNVSFTPGKRTAIIGPNGAGKSTRLKAMSSLTPKYEGQVLLDGEDVSNLIRTPEVGAAASAVSTVKAVRRRMVALQQACAAKADMVVDGRDIGTVVLPNATCKFYLTASPEVRARRRFLEMQQKGAACSYEEILKGVIDRDYQDMHREADPLRQAADARVIDSSNLTLDETVQAMLNVIREVLA